MLRNKWKGLGAAVTLTAALIVSGCGGSVAPSATGSPQGNGLQDVKVMLEWSPNTNHTGLYAAEALGYYEEEGLDVEIMMPSSAGVNQVVASGEVDFGISVQEEVTLARTQGIPVVSLATIIQHNTSGFAAPKALGIKTPKDFEGKTYGGWGSPTEQAIIQAVMSEAGADFSKLNIVSIGENDFFTAQKNGIDLQWVFYAWTGIEAELRGEPVDMVYLKDYSEKLDYYTPIIVTNEDHIANQSELVKKFMRATSRGYTYAIEHPAEAAELLIGAVPEINAELVRASQEWLSPKYAEDAPRWGEQKLEVWQNYADFMVEHSLLEGEFDASQAFTNEFLPE